VLGDSANGLSSLVVPEQWTRLIRDVLQWPLERRLVVMIVGERNVGKSTLARLLANSLLNKYFHFIYPRLATILSLPQFPTHTRKRIDMNRLGFWRLTWANASSLHRVAAWLNLAYRPVSL
jgi:pantothenate kinase-related protein Tda10